MIDGSATSAFIAGFGFALTLWVIAWGTLAIVKFAKDVLSGVSP